MKTNEMSRPQKHNPCVLLLIFLVDFAASLQKRPVLHLKKEKNIRIETKKSKKALDLFAIL